MRRQILLLIASLCVAVAAMINWRPRAERAQVVRPEALAALIDRADKVVVHRGPREESPVLFESSDRRDLDALRAALRVEKPEEHLHCMCDGSPAVVLYAKGEKIGQITNHHGRLIRCSLWKSDAPIADAEAFLKWFDERKIPGPRQEYEEGLELEKEQHAQMGKWVKAMPSSLKPLWPAAMQSHDPDLAPFRAALVKQLPAKNERIMALFSWYGSGAGPWSGYPAYEGVAEDLLLDYPTADLLAAVEGQSLTGAQIEGVARLFGGWTFSQRRPDDRRLLPAELRARLLDHSLKDSDEDKRGRAQRAFGER